MCPRSGFVPSFCFSVPSCLIPVVGVQGTSTKTTLLESTLLRTPEKETRNSWHPVPKRGRSKRGQTQNERQRAQMRAKERKRKSAKERKRSQRGAKECKRALPRKKCKPPGLKHPGLGAPKAGGGGGGGQNLTRRPPTENSFRPPSPRHVLPPHTPFLLSIDPCPI